MHVLHEISVHEFPSFAAHALIRISAFHRLSVIHRHENDFFCNTSPRPHCMPVIATEASRFTMLAFSPEFGRKNAHLNSTTMLLFRCKWYMENIERVPIARLKFSKKCLCSIPFFKKRSLFSLQFFSPINLLLELNRFWHIIKVPKMLQFGFIIHPCGSLFSIGTSASARSFADTSPEFVATAATLALGPTSTFSWEVNPAMLPYLERTTEDPCRSRAQPRAMSMGRGSEWYNCGGNWSFP